MAGGELTTVQGSGATTPSIESPFVMKISLNVLEHLGINLYSSAPAVLAETVANSWDADATDVRITIKPDRILIWDDGHGMRISDINNKFLTVGYPRRKHNEAVTPGGRRVMGRKGIGKLSLFSIAERIQIFTKRAGEENGFEMRVTKIREALEAEKAAAQAAEQSGQPSPPPHPYRPVRIPMSDCPDLLGSHGTLIVLTELTKKQATTAPALVRRLARRFTVIEPGNNFKVKVNDHLITLADRGYHDKIQYMWTYGAGGDAMQAAASNLAKSFPRNPEFGETERFVVSGWIGSTFHTEQMKEPDGGKINKIILLMRGKLAHEDLMAELTDGGLYTKYLFGELHAEFLDDGDVDPATSNRQGIKEDDLRYIQLLKFVEEELKAISVQWLEERRELSFKGAVETPVIKEWFAELKPDERNAAKGMLGKIANLQIDNTEDRLKLYKYAIMAFEKLSHQRNLEALEDLDENNLDTLKRVFGDLNDLEASLYAEIIEQRLEVISTLREHVDKGALEKVVQEFLFEHLWLLDPAWERATEEPVIEAAASKGFQKAVPDANAAGRIDIRYRKTTAKHVIVELKRPDRMMHTGELLDQGDKYVRALDKVLAENGAANESVEVVFIVGVLPDGWEDAKVRQKHQASLQQQNMRVVLYGELLTNAYRQYSAFLKAQNKLGRLNKAVRRLEKELAAATKTHEELVAAQPKPNAHSAAMPSLH